LPPLNQRYYHPKAHGKLLISVCIFYGLVILSNFTQEIKDNMPIYHRKKIKPPKSTNY